MTIRNISVAAAMLAAGLTAAAADFNSVLGEIERNNKTLRALRSENAASVTELKSQSNIWGAPTVEFSPFFGKGRSGMASYEFIASQEMEFPTLKAERDKVARSEERVLNAGYLAARCDLMLTARKQLIELVKLGKLHKLTTSRLENYQALLTDYEKRMDRGEATVLEINKLKMDIMQLRTELLQNESAIQSGTDALTLLNGGEPLSLNSLDYPALRPVSEADSLVARLLEADNGVLQARATIDASRQALRLQSRSWLPSLRLGYRRNGDGDESVNGMLVGVSFPIFGNSSKVKAARQRMEAATLGEEAARQQAEAALTARTREYKRMAGMLGAYDLDLMTNTLALMKKAVDAGRMSLPEYRLECENIYTRMAEYYNVEGDMHLLQADIFKSVD